MSTKEISAAAQALGRRGGLKSLGAKSKAELSAFGKAAAAKRWKKPEAVGGMFSAGAQARFDPEEHRYPGGNMPDPQTLAFEAGIASDARKAVKREEFAVMAARVGPPPITPLAGSPERPKRPLPKDGTLVARVLSVVSNLSDAFLFPEGSEIGEVARRAGLDRATTRAALAHLKVAGHVESAPKPGSNREKLWRLA